MSHNAKRLTHREPNSTKWRVWWRRYRYVVWILLATVLLLAPYWLNTAYPTGHDTSYHIANIVGLAQGSWWDLFSPSIISFIGNDLGYGSGLFYPQLAHILPAFLLKLGAPLGVSAFVAARLAAFLILFVSGLLIYKLVVLLRNNQKAGLVAAILYMGATYHLSDILIRDAQGESMVFVFLPLLGIALYYLYHQRLRLFLLLFVISVVGLMSSHLVMTMYTAFFALIFIIWHRRHFFTKRRLLYLVGGGVLSLLLMAPFLVALFQNALNIDIQAFTDNFMFKGYALALVKPYTFFNLEYTYNSIVWALNLVAAVFLIYILATQQRARRDRLLQSLLGISAIIIVIMVAVPFAKLPDALQMIQFPWRLNLFLCFTLALSCALAFAYLQKPDLRRLWFGLLALGCLIGATTVWSNVTYDSSYTLDSVYAGTLTWRDYLPLSALNDRDYVGARSSDEVVSGKASTVISDFENNFPGLSFSVTLGDGAGSDTDGEATNSAELVGDTLELPRYFYLGYQVIATYADGTSEELYYHESEYGLMEIYVTRDATITVTYTGTRLQQAARAVATITAVSGVAYVVVTRVPWFRRVYDK